MKLGLILRITSCGDGETFSANKEENWGKYATDPRSIIKEFSKFDGTQKFIIIAKFYGPLGYLLGVVQARPEGSGRPNDNTVAWIHVPSNIQISGNELASVIDIIEKEISARSGINYAKLEELFSHEYGQKEILVSAVSMILSDSEKAIGYRYYGKGTRFVLSELLGNSIAQANYNNFRCVCLVDAESNITSTNAVNIPGNLSSIITTLPPTDQFGFTLHLLDRDSTIFNKPIETPVGSVLKVKWVKENFADIPKEFTVKECYDNKIPRELLIENSEKKVIIRKTWFKVFNEQGHPLKNYTLTINGKDFWTDELPVSESEIFTGLVVAIQHPKYESVTKTIDNSSLTQNMQFYMQDKIHTYTYTLHKEDGIGLEDDATVTIETKRSYKGLPLKGYYSDGDYIYHSNNLKSKIVYFISGVLSVFAVALIYGLFATMSDFIDTHEFTGEWPFCQEKKVQNQTFSDPSNDVYPNSMSQTEPTWKNYLDKTKVWNKDSLSTYDATKNLYIYMNTFDFNGIKSMQKDLAKSVNYSLLLNAVERNIDKMNVLQSQKKNEGRYNDQNDIEIDIDNYIAFISKEHKSNAKNEHKPNATKSSNNSNKVSKITNKKIEKEQPSKKSDKKDSSNGRGGYKN